MPMVPFSRLMEDAERGGYAVGYFESWNMESLLAVADAAEAARSPVILGFSGISLPHPRRVARDHLADYHALGAAVCRRLETPSCLLFNESPDMSWVEESIRLGFGLVMYAEDDLPRERLLDVTRHVTGLAHAAGVAVEAELDSLPGLEGGLAQAPADTHLTDPSSARRFVEETGIDALAVNVGQVHLHGRKKVSLDLGRLEEIRALTRAPLVLHGASSLQRDDVRGAIRRGVRKINVGSALKQAWFEAMRAGCAGVPASYNPYEVVGSGLSQDVLSACRSAVRSVVEDFMELFGSAGRSRGA